MSLKLTEQMMCLGVVPSEFYSALNLRFSKMCHSRVSTSMDGCFRRVSLKVIVMFLARVVKMKFWIMERNNILLSNSDLVNKKKINHGVKLF
jgi:hypothetical protein